MRYNYAETGGTLQTSVRGYFTKKKNNPTSSFGHRVEGAFKQVSGLGLSARVHEIFRLQMPNFVRLGAEFADHRVENLIGQLKKTL